MSHPAGAECGLGTIADLEFLEDVGHVVLHGLDAHPEAGRDLGIVRTLSDESEDLRFTRSEVDPVTRRSAENARRSLLRLVTIFGRYLQDMATTPSQVPGNTPVSAGPWDRARGQAREALTNSAGYLIGPGTSGRRWPAAPSASPLAQCLDQVATSLTAGRDLLHTHFAPGPKGWVHRSPWAGCH